MKETRLSHKPPRENSDTAGDAVCCAASKSVLPKALHCLKNCWMLLLFPLGCLLVILARQSPEWTERLYSGSVYPVLAGTLGAVTSIFPFSIMELLICGMIAAVLFLLVWEAAHAVRVRKGKAQPVVTNWKQLGIRAANLVSCILFVAVIMGGLNYYRPEFTVFSGLTVRESTTEELAALCRELTEKANILRQEVFKDVDGVMRLSGRYRDTARTAKETFGRLAEDYEVLPNLNITPKPVLNSWWMSMLQITGIFIEFTYEANINVAAPDYSIPATMCHELAHTRGFMREDEANFIAYLACEKSDSAEFQYSGVMLALVYSIDRLYAADGDAYYEVSEMMYEGVRRDFADNNAYWAQYEGPVAEVSQAVNNTYLKVNNQRDGVQSYGRMVDLLLADYRARNNLE